MQKQITELADELLNTVRAEREKHGPGYVPSVKQVRKAGLLCGALAITGAADPDMVDIDEIEPMRGDVEYLEEIAGGDPVEMIGYEAVEEFEDAYRSAAEAVHKTKISDVSLKDVMGEE